MTSNQSRAMALPPTRQGATLRRVLLAFLALYLATGIYCGYFGDTLDYVCLGLEPACWHSLPIHVGYFALLHALSFWTASFSQALAVQTLLSVAAGVAGLGAFYGIARRLFPDRWRGFSGDQLALLATAYAGLCGGYWIFATSGEILGVQHAALLLACYCFMTGRDWRGAGCFFAACAVSPLAGLAAPGALLLRAWHWRAQPRRPWAGPLAAGVFWAGALLALYGKYHIIPGIDFRLNLRAGVSANVLGHSLSGATIPWAEAMRVLGRVYLRAASVLLPLGAVGLATALANWRRFGVWLGLAGLWVLAHLFLLTRLSDVWSHTSIWFVLLAGFAALGTAVICQWAGRCGLRSRRAPIAALILAQFALTCEAWVIPIYEYSLDNRRSGRVALQLGTPDAVWVGIWGTYRVLLLANPANRPGKPMTLAPVAAACIDLKDLKTGWSDVAKALREGHPVYALINNRRALGPVLKHFLNPVLALPEAEIAPLRLRLVTQAGLFGIYRVSAGS